jgi:hypothetical protein
MSVVPGRAALLWDRKNVLHWFSVADSGILPAGVAGGEDRQLFHAGLVCFFEPRIDTN